MKIVFAFLLCFSINSFADEIDPRYCHEQPLRDKDGSITRDMGEVAKFKRIHPCPETGLPRGACPGWAVDHVIPLAVGGCDTIVNMQWLNDQIKSCAGKYCKDRFELKIYDRQHKQ